MKRYAFYPGCSLEKNARAYYDSIMAVAPRLGLDLQEIDDWNCCGATEYIALDLLPAYALVARNLALAAEQRLDSGQLVAPCSACYLNLRKADYYLQKSPGLAEKINKALAAGDLSYEPGSIKTRHLLEIIVKDVGFERVGDQVRRPLQGLRVAPYYGCLIVRPEFDRAFDDPEYPTTLDRLVATLGAEVIDYPVKAHCCGGHMTQISEGIALDLLYRLLKSADDYEADVIVTLCPMCQLNLDAYQGDVNARYGTNYQIPVLYFTQLMGLAFGSSPQEVGIGQEFVDARPALARIGSEQDAPEQRRRRPAKQQGLPMPARLEEG